MKILVPVNRVVDDNVKMSINPFDEISAEEAPIFRVADLSEILSQLEKAL